MNLKNLALASVLILTAGCDEKDLDQVLVDQLWTKTVEITGIDPGTPKPDLGMLDEDLYHKILRTECESKSGGSKEDCLADRKELEDSVLPKTGKDYASRYAGYLQADRKILNENCGEYSDKTKKSQCEADKVSARGSGNILGRAFLGNNYVEIYYENIWSYLRRRDEYYASYHLPFSYEEKEGFFYSVIAHEMLHIALHIKGADSDDHHRMMRDTYMDPLMNLISDYENAGRKGYHREMAFSSLEVGINGDEASKRIKNRENSDSHESKKETLVLPCGLRIQ